ncbi:MAG: hypothetical protein GX853_09885 [Chloroflexi bacterium]|jgi:hypothetical protein|nr:hypothetical protein [Chloroflexota bacterium]
MTSKILPRPDMIRRVPRGFGWIDHRFVREGHIRGLSRESLTLYLFLVTVANEAGISWYSEERLRQLTGLDSGSLSSARRELSSFSLVAYDRPVYQVLELPRCPRSPRLSGAEAAVPVQNDDVAKNDASGRVDDLNRGESLIGEENCSRRLEGTYGISEIFSLLAKGGKP